MNDGNENIMAVEAIENYLIEIDNQIERISPTSKLEREARQALSDDIEDIRSGSLPNLRIYCEGD